MKNIDNIISGFTVGGVVVLAWFITGGDLGQEWIETNDFMDVPLPSVGWLGSSLSATFLSSNSSSSSEVGCGAVGPIIDGG